MSHSQNAGSDANPEGVEKATFGAGCFWCVEAVFDRVPGVLSTTSGYMGGAVDNPTYREVCTGQTGHAEVVQVVFDPAAVSFEALLQTFWLAHDPTTLNRQGADEGTQYRSAIFYHGERQRKTAENLRAAAEEAGLYPDPIVTEITPAATFFPAEDDHDDYFKNNPNAPYCHFVIRPKLDKLAAGGKLGPA